jgi:hypothetical protein
MVYCQVRVLKVFSWIGANLELSMDGKKFRYDVVMEGFWSGDKFRTRAVSNTPTGLGVNAGYFSYIVWPLLDAKGPSKASWN